MDKVRKILIIVALGIAIIVGSFYLYGKYEASQEPQKIDLGLGR